MKTNIIIIAIVSILVSSCYKSEDINANMGEIRYKLEKGSIVDNNIYNFYEKYGRFILYKYKPLDYQWNITNKYSHDFVPIFNYYLEDKLKDELSNAEDELENLKIKNSSEKKVQEQEEKIINIKEKLSQFKNPEFIKSREELEILKKDTILMGYNVLEKVFINLYDDNFKQRYFPFKIFLANSLNCSINSRAKKDLISHYGQSFIAMGRVRKGIENLSGDELNKIKAAINTAFWGGYLNINHKYKIPERFYEISKKYYKINLRGLEENKGKTNKEISYHTYGFWEADKKGLGDWGNYKYTPDESQDIEDTIKAIFSTPKDEFINTINEYPLLKQKYNILAEYFKREMNIDINDIVNIDFNNN